MVQPLQKKATSPLSPSIAQFVNLPTFVVIVANVIIKLWTLNGFHPIFIYIPINVEMFLTLWKPYVMFPFNFLPLLPQLFLLWKCHLWYLLHMLPQLFHLWKCHLWYLYNLSNCLYLTRSQLLEGLKCGCQTKNSKRTRSWGRSLARNI